MTATGTVLLLAGCVVLAAACKRDSREDTPAAADSVQGPIAPIRSLPDDSSGLLLADPLTWPRATSRQFGCMLEKAGYPDLQYNCTSPISPPASNPCTDTVTVYDRGPDFPDGLVPRVGGQIQRIDLDWAHGDLRAVSLIFKSGVDSAAIRNAFRLPDAKEEHRNVMDVSIQQCTRDGFCLLLQGFDYMGASDYDCGAADDGDTTRDSTQMAASCCRLSASAGPLSRASALAPTRPRRSRHARVES